VFFGGDCCAKRRVLVGGAKKNRTINGVHKKFFENVPFYEKKPKILQFSRNNALRFTLLDKITKILGFFMVISAF
jgi:hypothetical protein